ncbi:MAG TPA: acetyl-CoA carboxylase biotin carboxyl carrier protein [Trueperaceae bacterium]|nr:acetyl-CoA carboxylase biotin carboxyl carrier protein [Trueperaceae bacterium]
MDVKDIKRLLDVLAKSDVREVTLETGDYKLNIKRGAEQVVYQMPATAQAPAGGAAQPQAPLPAVAGGAAGPAPTTTGPAAPSNEGLVEVVAPIVGTFYSSPSPEAPAYVKVGDRVTAGTVMCIIEAMKLMNEIEAEVAGVVREVLVENDDPVEYGQVLFRIEPD